MKIQPTIPARDFSIKTFNGQQFRLSDYKGHKILLSFYRNGACAICNLRIHELITHHTSLEVAGVKVVAVFESSVDQMIPFVARQNAPFVLIPDAAAELYNLYGIETSEEKINHVMQSGIAHNTVAQAARQGFPLMPQEGSNFYRMPADFLIDENFVIRRSHYSDHLIDHITIPEVLEFAKS